MILKIVSSRKNHNSNGTIIYSFNDIFLSMKIYYAEEDDDKIMIPE